MIWFCGLFNETVSIKTIQPQWQVKDYEQGAGVE
jgi:hypothetical protein